MSTLFAIVVVLVAVAAVVYAIWAAQRKRAGEAGGRRTLTNLRVGDIVRYRMMPECNFTVSGFIDYRENGYTWREVRLVDGKTVRWLGIEEEDFELELVLWREVDLGFSVSGRIPAELQFGGHTYRQEENGRAEAVLRGQTGNRQQLECSYWDYKEVGGERLLSIEQWGSDFEVSLGDRVRPGELDIFAP
ncbi:MAG: DUF4178 domain-containing protein [Armatimonadetes bacterium]|nr:DUF4178 domain-containing protein [Armatimonadota bacterium]